MKKKCLITGGAGFIGSNYACRLIKRGENVTILDNLSRKGARENLKWIESETGRKDFKFILGDIRDNEAVYKAVEGQEVIIHLAAQVAVTTSVEDPRTDFDINAGGTFNVLEAARQHGSQPQVIYASTNKVYGGLEDLEIVEESSRYQFKDFPNGIDEIRRLDFHSPYGCSKGCGDQYMHDYHRIYEIPTVVFRQSCIYGKRQFGVEDQGWLAWFIIAIILGKQIRIYGDGKQVRDVLYIEDLLDAYDAALENKKISQGQIYNVGGGAGHSISVWHEFSSLLKEISTNPIAITTEDWRPGDQKIYVSDIQKIKQQLGWEPKTGILVGIQILFDWVRENKAIFA